MYCSVHCVRTRRVGSGRKMPVWLWIMKGLLIVWMVLEGRFWCCSVNIVSSCCVSWSWWQRVPGVMRYLAFALVSKLNFFLWLNCCRASLVVIESSCWLLMSMKIHLWSEGKGPWSNRRKPLLLMVEITLGDLVGYYCSNVTVITVITDYCCYFQ